MLAAGDGHFYGQRRSSTPLREVTLRHFHLANVITTRLQIPRHTQVLTRIMPDRAYDVSTFECPKVLSRLDRTRSHRPDGAIQGLVIERT